MLNISEKRRAYFVLFAMMILILLINVDYTAVNIALLPISKDSGADLNTLQWLLSGYVLAWATLVIPAGQMADIYGKRRLLLWGVSLFALASILCGLVTSAPLLIFARVLQGFGGALFVPPLYALVFECFPPKKRGFAIGMLGVGAAIGLAIGPSFGGYILANFGWRWIFLINAPLCLLTISMIMLSVAKEPKRLSHGKVDAQGALLLGASLMGFMYALNQSEIWGLKDPALWSIFAFSLGLLIAFIKTSQHKENRLIPQGLFSNKPFVGCLIGFAVYCFSFSTVLVIIGLYLQNIQSYSPYEAGLIFLAMTFALGILSPFGGSLVDKMDARYPICGGLLLLGISLAYAMSFDANTDKTTLLFVLFTMGLGMGLSFPALNAMMMKVVDPKNLSTASGTFIMAACTSNSLGVVVSTSLFTGLGAFYFNQSLAMDSILLSPENHQALLDVLASAYRDLSSLGGFTAQEIASYISLINTSLVDALFWVMGLVALLSFGAALLCYRTIKLEEPLDNPETCLA
tara:strand:+ start:3844 stop:5397 length:1554 start_codon:yes stop_codon:yes gene_type:complete